VNIKKIRLPIAIGIFIFLLYAFLAASPIPEEDVLIKGWIRSFESAYTTGNEEHELYPFQIGLPGAVRFGYFDKTGVLTVNQFSQKNVSLSGNRFVEFDAVPRSLEIKDRNNETVQRFENTNGYPLFLNDRLYLVHYEQNAISELTDDGSIAWTYAFASPLTCIAGARGSILAGTLDGTVELLDEKGSRVFFFETGGSRITCIYGAAISRDLSYIAVVSGIDDQRFLLFEQYGGSYRVTHHEFIGDGRRRPVWIRFLDNDTRLAFEYEDGLGIYDMKSRTTHRIPLDGEIAAIDNEGSGLLFLVTANETRKYLTGILYPSSIILKSPFQSTDVFLHRSGDTLFIGSDRSLVSFIIDKR
jgi:hypothetical protein